MIVKPQLALSPEGFLGTMAGEKAERDRVREILRLYISNRLSIEACLEELRKISASSNFTDIAIEIARFVQDVGLLWNLQNISALRKSLLPDVRQTYERLRSELGKITIRTFTDRLVPLLKALVKLVKTRTQLDLSRPRVLLAVLKPNIHETGVLTAELLLLAHGIPVLNLGVRVPADIIYQRIIEYKPEVAVVAVYSDHSERREVTEPELRKLLARLNSDNISTRVYFTGYAAKHVYAELLKGYPILDSYVEVLQAVKSK